MIKKNQLKHCYMGFIFTNFKFEQTVKIL